MFYVTPETYDAIFNGLFYVGYESYFWLIFNVSMFYFVWIILKFVCKTLLEFSVLIVTKIKNMSA